MASTDITTLAEVEEDADKSGFDPSTPGLPATSIVSIFGIPLFHVDFQYDKIIYVQPESEKKVKYFRPTVWTQEPSLREFLEK